jgi:hypothetical protein
MSLKLYQVQIERTLYVLASDACEAEDIARDNELEDCSSADSSTYAREEKVLAHVPREWVDSLPYRPRGCEDKDLTVRQILSGKPI